MGVSFLKVYLVCSRVTLVVFYCLLLFLVIIGVFKCVSVNNGVTADFEELRGNFLAQLGVEEITPPTSCNDIVIPYEFNKIYQDYNNIQKYAGFDLTLYKGQTAQLFTYNYKNYFIHLILIKGKIVGGDFTENLYDGKVLPLNTESVNEINKT